ncbi:hypothetical protein MCUN1_001600 [Malassezia cuniculi]|uniref:Cleavage and polyadenylation specificity factor subunit 2 n=1 Tax=Malassezia cuniculi TaxID=948313 RepID=A0AAF0JAY1_9BASI|nr:hypothetical protein MCUN1_001600 [Malassezia cuniculi]
MLEFTPLSGPYVPQGTSGDEKADVRIEQPKALAYLLEIDQVRVLLDCGAPESFDFSGMQAPPGEGELIGLLPDVLARIAPTIDLVLLTHASVANMGFYAYARARLGLMCPAYATLPVQTMGRLGMLEARRTLAEEVDLKADNPYCVPTETEIDDAFESIRAVRYMQPTALDGKCAGLVLSAYGAGHSLGGTVWKLRSPSVGTIVMAIDWNHNRERHIDGTALLATAGEQRGDAVGRPDVLITSIERGLLVNARRKECDAALLDMINRTLVGGHSVLIPVDSAPRLLELLVLLDQHWAFAYQHMRFPLCLVSHTGQEFVERARTFMEWTTKNWATQLLSDKGKKKGRTATLQSPLDFGSLRFYSSMEALRSSLAPSQAKVVLATPPTLACGASQHMLNEMLADPDALVLLTSRSEPGSLTRSLFERWNSAQSEPGSWRAGRVGIPVSVGGHMSYTVRRRVRLAGEELRAYVERTRAANEAQERERTHMERSQRKLEADVDDSSDSDSSSDGGADDDGEDTLHASTRGLAPERLGNEGAALSFDIYLRGSASRMQPSFGAADGEYGAGVRYRMFPFAERKRKVDCYGEAIDTSRWLSRRRKMEAEQEAKLDPEARAPRTRRSAPAPEPPSKYVTEQVTTAIRCRIAFIDMQGLSDGRAVKTLLPQLQPRRLVMVNGDTATDADMVETLSSVRSLQGEIHAVPVGATIRIGALTNAYNVRLGDSLMSALRWSSIEGYNVVHLHGITQGSDGDEVLTLVGAPEDSAASDSQRVPGTLYIGDLKLSSLKSTLSRKHNMRADFAGEGVLVCGGDMGSAEPMRNITVTKEGTGRIVIEGNLGLSLSHVRDSVHALYAQVDK